MGFREAITDYRYLRDRHYSDKAALKLVSDHHRLSAVQRNCLFRAVFPSADNRKRKAKLVGAGEVAGRTLGIDWYNVLITVESYLKGYPVFISDDGLLRDSSGTHGSYRTGKVTGRAITAILAAIETLQPAGSELFLDSPISFSADMAVQLRSRLAAALSVPCTVSVHASADFPLKSFPGVVATSDSSIIDNQAVRQVFDLPRHVLECAYHARIPGLEEMAGGSDTGCSSPTGS